MRIYKVKSFTDEKKEYVVRQFDNGMWRCSCPNFIVNEKRIGGVCKHIKSVKKRIGVN